MANRTTLKEAQELKAEWETTYPDRKFGYTGGQQVFEAQVWNKKWGAAPDHIIIEGDVYDDRGYISGYKRSDYQIFEIYVCKHGVEQHTKAIGEIHICNCIPQKSPQTEVTHWHDQWHDMDNNR